MASSESTMALNHAESPNGSNSPSRKRQLNGLTSEHSENPLENDVSRSNNGEAAETNTPPPCSPENGRRKRKKTRAFEIPGPTFARRISTGALGVSGRGVKLSAVPNIVYAMEKRHAKSPEIEFLHRLLFNSAGTVLKRKTNIRSFSGFVFRSEKERDRVRDKLMRSHLNLLKRVATMLDVHVNTDKESRSPKDKKPVKDKDLERAAEAFLGTDSLASEDLKDDLIRSRTGSVDKASLGQAREVSKLTSPLTNERSGDPSSDLPSKLTKEQREGEALAFGDHLAREKYEKVMSRQRKEEAARITREETARAILSFLEMPRVPEGRKNLAQQEKEKKRLKKALEKAKAQKAMLKKAEEKRKELLAKNKARESDEDGDEDLEIEAKSWIVLARERQEREQSR